MHLNRRRSRRGWVWGVSIVCGGKVVGVNKTPTSSDYIAGMLDGDVIFI